MFGIGGFELFLIIVFAFCIFGPKKLPEIIKIAGLCVKKFKKAKAEMDKVVHEEIVDPVMEIANEPERPKAKQSKEVEEKTPAENDIKNNPKAGK